MIFVDQPEGVEFLDEARKAMVQLEDGEVLQLLRSLYGLKQAGRNWAKILRKILIRKGFTPCKMDPCLYINKKNIQRGKGVMAIGTYVDDLPIISTDLDEYLKLIDTLKKEIPIINLGEAKWFLSVEITQNDQGIELNQTREIEETYKEINDLISKKKWSTPLEEKVYNQGKEYTGKLLDKDYQELYRSLIGSLLYVSEWTRPDLGFATSFLSRLLQGTGNI